MYFETEGPWLGVPDQRMCMIGLGGGQLSNYLFHHIPGLELDVVDICPEVPDNPRYRLHVADARVFIEGLAERSVDLLVLDAFRGHSIPIVSTNAADALTSAQLHENAQALPGDLRSTNMTGTPARCCTTTSSRGSSTRRPSGTIAAARRLAMTTTTEQISRGSH